MIESMAALHYRTKQFLAALNPHIADSDRQLVQSVLGQNRRALALFQQMSVADQQHAIAVLQALLDRDERAKSDIGLQQAALLHDAGKALGQPLLYRVAIVLLNFFWPAGLNKLAQAPLTCAAWRKPFVIHAQHPQIGATWAQEAGCSKLTVTLINIHQEKPPSTPKTQLEKWHQALYEVDSEH